MMDEMLPDCTPEERRNVELVREYMGIACDPKRASAKNVAHLCAQDNGFTAPTTFPGIRTLEQYAEKHGEVMKEVADLHLVNFDVFYARGNHVCLRYAAEGTHCGKPHGHSRQTGERRHGPRQPCSGSRTGSSASSSRTGTSSRCGSSSACRSRSADRL
jgi:hypothetical protein